MNLSPKNQPKKVNYKKLANYVRKLSIEQVEEANSGHPGMPLGMADIATVLWQKYLKINPSNPTWINRDRFVISNGHGSALLYSLLYLSGFPLSIKDLKEFRQINSKTPGHPEIDLKIGVETTTGPLGQGLANAVGFAISEQKLREKFGKQLINHFTYVFAGDGCLMEGVSHEVCSLAGTLNLNKLIVFWDNNNISIDGDVKSWFGENTKDRFTAYGWNVIEINGHNYEEIEYAIESAQSSTKPTLISCKTIIGFGSNKFANTAAVHGSPLGKEELISTLKNLEISEEKFYLPEDVLKEWREIELKGKILEDNWHNNLPKNVLEDYESFISNPPNESVKEALVQLIRESKDNSLSSRKASGKVINLLYDFYLNLFGGSADLTESNCTKPNKIKSFVANDSNGSYLHYGVREFGMAAICNGIAAYGSYIPYCGTFLTFADYCRNAIRMSALMHLRCIYVFTHDSIGLGEDGPTHQPIEHLTMLRATPNLNVFRPYNLAETATSWFVALQSLHTPSAICLSRQNIVDKAVDKQLCFNGVFKGAYVIAENAKDTFDLIIVATGSEVELALDVYNSLQNDLKVRVVSMPCQELFDAQHNQYKLSVFPDISSKIVSIEAGATLGWYKYVGSKGLAIGVDSYGHSGKYKEIYRSFGLDVEQVVSNILNYLKKDLV